MSIISISDQPSLEDKKNCSDTLEKFLKPITKMPALDMIKEENSSVFDTVENKKSR